MAHSSIFLQFKQLLIQARNANLAEQGREPAATNPSRRAFLRNSALGGAVLASSGALGGCWGTRNERVAIIGGGLAGLNAAYQLGKVGLNVNIYEARGRVGGRVRTIHDALGAGLDTDLGGELVNSDHDDMLALIEEMGLSLTSRLEPNPDMDKVAFFYGGRKRSEYEMAQALRPFAKQLMIDAEALDEDWDTYAPIFDNQSLAEYLDMYAHLLPSDPDIRDLMEGAVRVEYGVEPEDSSILQLLYLLPVSDGQHLEVLSTSDEAYVINGGSEGLVAGLRSVLSDRIHTNRALQRLQKTDSGYRLHFNHGRAVDAEYVILALPFTALRNVQLDVALPDTLNRFIHEVDLGRNEKVIAGVTQKVWRGTRGFEVEAWNDQTVSLLWDSSLRQPDLPEGSITFFAGGNEVDTISQGSTSEQGQALMAEYSNVIGGLASVSNQQFARTSWLTTQYIHGGYTNFKPGQYTELAEEWLYIEADEPEDAQDFVFENLIFAGEHTSDEYYGFMNGAAQSGRLAAIVLVKALMEQ